MLSGSQFSTGVRSMASRWTKTSMASTADSRPVTVAAAAVLHRRGPTPGEGPLPASCALRRSPISPDPGPTRERRVDSRRVLADAGGPVSNSMAGSGLPASVQRRGRIGRRAENLDDRIQVPAVERVLAGQRFHTPSGAGLGVTGPVELEPP